MIPVVPNLKGRGTDASSGDGTVAEDNDREYITFIHEVNAEVGRYAASPSLDLLCFPESLQLLLQQVHSSGPQSYAVTIHDFCPCLHKLLITAVPGLRAPKYVHPMPHVVSVPRPNVVSIILLRGLLRPWSTQPPDLLS